MSQCYGYVRVSTVRQGEKGVSLQEQRDAIVRYAERGSHSIIQWFEERETAAKRGRPVFGQMMKQLRQRKADGVVIHKIDRGARNLKDWSDLGEMIDQGIEVHFANESLDLHSRGGRLSADIQAVVSADYIRNLREEAKKGIYGRLKQGIWPLPAPIGYLDKGAGKPKEFDPERAPLVRKAFELYASGQYSLDTLIEEMYRRGLRNRQGGKLGRNAFSITLNNPFYIGLLRVKRTGQMFDGAHEPLIKKSVFDRVQNILRGRFDNRSRQHDFIFRKLIKCKLCGYTLIGERQKGRVYYRCQTSGCPTKSVREDRLLEAFTQALAPLKFNSEEIRLFKTGINRMRAEWGEMKVKESETLKLQIAKLGERLGRLMDIFVDGGLESELFQERKAALLMERKNLEQRITELEADSGTSVDRVAQFLELVESLDFSLKMAEPDEIRDIVQNATSNRCADSENVDFKLSIPFQTIADRDKRTDSGPCRDAPRTFDRIVARLISLGESLPEFRRKEEREVGC